MTKHTEVAPQLPPASVDFNKLHDQMKSGADGDKAVKAAVFTETLAEPSDGGVPAADTAEDALSRMTRKDRQARLRELGVRFETDANLDRLGELLRAHPDGIPSVLNPEIIADEPASAPGTVADAG